MTKEEVKLLIETELQKPPGEISIISLVDNLILYAYKLKTSDIHFEPQENTVKVRARVDGVLYTIFYLPREIKEEIISRIKVLAGLRTDEHNAPQDGRFKFKIFDEDKNFDIRVSIMPTYHGENAVLRLLAQSDSDFKIEALGFSERDLAIVKENINRPYGMILVTGPTGSGKTTTLYTILSELNSDTVSIVTLEDPVEYSISNITQIQVNPFTGLTFGSGLRSILRQDPNIIMVGEIRDKETATIAINAALTGHLLLSTLHTNDAPTAVVRLSEMGIEDFLISSTVNVVIAQRLVRKICPSCKTEKAVTLSDLEVFNKYLPKEELYQLENIKTLYFGKGCNQCNQTGYLGRMGIFEVMPVTKAIQEVIMKGWDSNQIKEVAIQEQMTTLIQDGFKKVLKGITTIEEVLRVTHE